MSLPGFTAAATVEKSRAHYGSEPRVADRLDWIGPAGIYRCGTDCICDPGQCCQEKTFSCACKACTAATETAKFKTILTR
jgi:hypothetical protein